MSRSSSHEAPVIPVTLVLSLGRPFFGLSRRPSGPPSRSQFRALSIQQRLTGISGQTQLLELPCKFPLADCPSGNKHVLVVLTQLTRAKFITNTIAECPKTQFVLSGYSQGGYAVHNAAKNLDAKSMSKVKAVVIFGDPMSKEPVRGIDASRVSIVCHEGDDICDGGVFITPQHITYAEDAESSANFVVSKL